jgi:hypothetical protein
MVFFSERYLPLYFSVSWGPWDKGDYESYLSAFQKLVAQRNKFLVVSEARWTKLPGANERKQIAEMSDEVTGLAGALSVGGIAVLSSKLAVGAATAVAWLSRRKNDTVYVSSAADAIVHARQICKQHALTLPAEVDTLARTLDRLAAQGEPPVASIRALL